MDLPLGDWGILAVPLVAGVLALVTHVPLGVQVLRRGVVFLDLAIAQIAALGVLAADMWMHADPTGHGPSEIMGCAAALLGVTVVGELSRRWPGQREALIGLLYVGAAAVAILLTSLDPHGGQKLSAMLSGDVLWVTWTQLVPLAVATALFAGLQWSSGGRLLQGRAFYATFGVLVSLSVPLLGIYLVFATLIAPALMVEARPTATVSSSPGVGGLSSSIFSSSRGAGMACAFGIAAYLAGLSASLLLDLPAGPCVVLALLLMLVVVVSVSRRA